MINNNKKTTILLTSMTLSLILLLPSVAFAEDPDDCAIGTGNVGGSVTVVPSFKVEIDAIGDTFVTYEISIPAIGPPVSCNAIIGFFGDALITVNGIEVTTGGDCAAPGANVPIGDGDTVQLWGPASEYGTCNIAADLVEGTNLIFGIGNVGQFNNVGPNPSFQGATNSAQRDVYTVCIDVDKTGPAKVLLDESGKAIVKYTVTITNCADVESPLASALDNCVLDDTVAGMIPVPGAILPGQNTQVMYMVEINGDTPNTAIVTCEDQEDIVIDDSDSHTVFTYTAGIIVLKTAPPKVADEDQVIWNVKITNDGSTSIDNCEIADPAFGFFDDITCAAPIAPGGMCSVDIPGVICIESVPNTVFVTCEDQEDQDVEGQDTADPPFCADFSVMIEKACDTKVVVVPDNDADPIDCSITVTNDGPGTLTNCLVTDTLSGVLPLPSTLTPGQVAGVVTQTAVTQQMIDDMEVTNTATVVCDTQDDFPPVEDEAEATIQIRSVDATVEKMCEPATQTEPGVIDWEWWITNTSPDGKSDLTVDCEGVSTLNDPEIQDFFSNVLTFTESKTHNMWTESELDPGVYENMITCIFTAQDDRTFEREAMDSCEVEPDVEVRGCTPGFWKGNEKGATNACQWVEEDPSDLVKDVFDVSNPNLNGKGGPDTLLDALKYKGGNCDKDGTERQLLRMAVAAKLNIEADFDYEIADLGALQTLVNDAINHPTDRCGEMKTVKNQLGEFNEGPEDFEELNEGESFCPLSNSVNACPAD